MGLDTLLRTKVWQEGDYDKNDDICYWRKCYGIDSWLSEHASEVIEPQAMWKMQTKLLKDSLPTFEKYINKLIKKSNKLGYEIEDWVELYTLVTTLDKEDEDMHELEKVIKSFEYEGLNYGTFESSIWSPISTFLQTYREFLKAVEHPALILISSY